MTTARNGFFDKKVTYRRDAAAERRELAARKKEFADTQADIQAGWAYDQGRDAKQKRRDADTRFDRITLVAAVKALGREKAYTIAKREYMKGYRQNPASCARTAKGDDISDRGKRYRANQEGCLPAGPEKCALCPARSSLMVDHKDGDETNGERPNLRWLCRSCNTKEGIRLAKQGKGRRTRQYNPKEHKGAHTLAEYVIAAAEHTRGAHDAGGKIIHDTPKSKRREFAAEIWERRGKYAEGRGNPVDAAAALAEAWHGRPAETETEYVDKIRVHEVLTDLGRLAELKVWVSPRHTKVINFDAKTRLASNEAGEQLYVVAGDQSLDLAAFGIRGHAAKKDLVKVGAVYSITYVTAKMHLGEADKTPGPYEHVFREHDQEEPDLVYDTMNAECGFAGGEYHIDIDIDGKYSAGIRD